MKDTQELAETTAPELESTAAPESAEQPMLEGEAEKASEKAFTQEELEAAIGKRLAKERRKWERQQREFEAQQAQQAPRSNDPISPEQFETYEDYAEALAVQKAEQLLRQREVQKHRSQVESVYADREEEARSKYDDFEQVAYNPSLPITEAMAETIKESDVGPDIAYYLGLNPKEADRIARLSPLQQAREIGKIEVRLANEPPVKKTTSAPAPINPVTSRASANPSYDTTDPRSVKSMSTSEWIEAERQRQIRKMQSQYNR